MFPRRLSMLSLFSNLPVELGKIVSWFLVSSSSSIYNKIYLSSFYFLLSSFSSIKTDSGLVNLLMFQNAKLSMCLLFLLFSLFYLINFILFNISPSLICCCVSTFLGWEINECIPFFSSLLVQIFKVMNFPLFTALFVSHEFEYAE